MPRRKPKAKTGPKPKPAADVRSTIRTVKLTPGEAIAQDAAAGDRPWATWAHDTLVEAAPPDDSTR